MGLFDSDYVKDMLKGAYTGAMIGNSIADPTGQMAVVLPALESQRKQAEAIALKNRELDQEDRKLSLYEKKAEQDAQPTMTDYQRKEAKNKAIDGVLMGMPGLSQAFAEGNTQAIMKHGMDHGLAPSDIQERLGDFFKLSQESFVDKTNGNVKLIKSNQAGFAEITDLGGGMFDNINQAVTYVKSLEEKRDILMKGNGPQQNDALKIDQVIKGIWSKVILPNTAGNDDTIKNHMVRIYGMAEEEKHKLDQEDYFNSGVNGMLPKGTDYQKNKKDIADRANKMASYLKGEPVDIFSDIYGTRNAEFPEEDPSAGTKLDPSALEKAAPVLKPSATDGAAVDTKKASKVPPKIASMFRRELRLNPESLKFENGVWKYIDDRTNKSYDIDPSLY